MFETAGLYKKLVVWQKAMQFVQCVYALVERLPANERFALSDQLRRAAVSIPSNIAEGSGRAGDRDYAHFLSIARGSLYETMTQLELAVNLGYIQYPGDEIESLACELSKMLTAMIKKYSPLSN
jgi:four helix bundle protein